MVSEFLPVAQTHEIAPRSARAFSVGRYEVAVFNVEGKFYALENSCPHQGSPLDEGALEGPFVTCPWHAWCFDVRSGKMALGDFAAVARFEVRIVGTTISIGTEPIDD